jgi:putative aldouronate transport system substrate-binding protein
MKNKKRSVLIPCVAMILAFSTACSIGNSGTQSEKKAEEAGGGQDSGVTTKFEPPIEITTVRAMQPTWKYPEGDSIEKNLWTRDLEQKNGIKVKYNWVAATAQYSEKFNVTMASGDLPDFVQVNADQLQKLIKDDQVADLTAVFEKYGSPQLKEILNRDGGIQMKSAKANNKLLAIPRTIDPINLAPVIWIRTDWLQKLNLKEPKTMQDVMAIAEAFVKNDPDGNGKPDTYGLAIHKNLFGGPGQLDGFLNGYHAYPNIWIKDAQGKLQFGSIRPEMKAALQKLQEMFKNKMIDPEFGVKDEQKTNEFISQGKSGMHFGKPTDLQPLQQFRNADPKADWYAFPLSSIDSKPAQPQTSFTGINYFAVNKKYKHPEALVMLLNNYVENMWGKGARAEFSYLPDGQPSFQWAPVFLAPFGKNLDAYRRVNEAIKTGNTAGLNTEEKDYHDKAVLFMGGDNKHFGTARIFGVKGSFEVIGQYMQNKQIIYDEFMGAATPTMAQKMASLNTLQLTTFTKIIMNAAPIEEFDKFVEDWMKLGGTQITQEVNEWYTKFK